MSKERITTVTLDEAMNMKGRTDWARFDAMTDEDIAKAVADDPSLPPLDVDWDKASLVIPYTAKDIITLRVDADVLEWLRSTGKGYQTRINQVLRAWYDASVGHKKAVSAGITGKPQPHITALEKRKAAAKTSRHSKTHASKKGRVSR